MVALRTLLVVLWVILAVYTGCVIFYNGMDFASVFLGAIKTVGWSGQFNLDFMFMLWLSALWVCWRNKFSSSGIMLGLCAFVGDFSFLAIYILVLSFQLKGDVNAILLGKQV